MGNIHCNTSRKFKDTKRSAFFREIKYKQNFAAQIHVFFREIKCKLFVVLLSFTIFSVKANANQFEMIKFTNFSVKSTSFLIIRSQIGQNTFNHF